MISQYFVWVQVDDECGSPNSWKKKPPCGEVWHLTPEIKEPVRCGLWDHSSMAHHRKGGRL